MQGWKTQDWKTRDLKSMESLTKHKCRNNVERESKAAAQKHRVSKASELRSRQLRLDDNSYSRIQFLRAVSHSVGAHGSRLCDTPTHSDSETSADDADRSELPL